MNRSIVGVGLSGLLLGGGLIAWPIATTGHSALTPLVELGILSLPAALAVVILGAAAPNPAVTTVAGVFGNPIENELRRRHASPPTPPTDRGAITPRAPTNCRQCYTLIPWDVRDCPRCRRARECRECGGRLEYDAPALRCSACARAEVYCYCPKRVHAAIHAPHRRGR